ncbi:LysR family transcriptional regulator [Latilactobacillus sakei]
MKLIHLQYFKKVFETQNITQAAKALYISQPALSRAIKHLESELGVTLFYHTGRNIEATPYAHTFYPYVTKTLAVLDDGFRAVTALNKEIITSVTLCLEVASVSVPNLIRIFSEKHPDIKLTIIQHHLPENINESVLFITSDSKPDLNNVPIIREPVLVAIPKSHPLAHKAILQTSDIEQTPIIMLSPSNAFRNTIDMALEANHIHPKISSTTDDPGTLRSIINQGLGITFFPQISWSYRANDHFVLKEIADVSIERTIYLSSTLRKDHPLVETIVTTLREWFICHN